MNKNSSIDIQELAKFDKVSDQWWNKNSGEFKILHEINPLRISYIKYKIGQHFSVNENQDLSNLRVLDVGCGGGLVSTELSKTGAALTGIDASPNAIESAKSYAKAHNLNVNYLHSTAEELVPQDKQYDVVLCLEVIEHISNPSDFIKNISKLIKPGGMFILSTINRNVKSYGLAILMAEYLLRWVPRKTHEFVKFIKPSELNILLEDNKLRLKELKGLNFNLLTQSWHLTDDVDVNYFAYGTL